MHAKLVSSFQFDTAFPRDAIVCTLNFNNTGGIFTSEDWDGLCEDLAEVWDTYWFTGDAPKITVKAYDNEGTPPVYPAGEFIRNPTATPPNSTWPREIALCLSYYSERNVPRRRGRVYLPWNVKGTPGGRPSSTQRSDAIAMGGHFADLGGVDIDWEVWSPTSSAGMQVSNTFVDDEWDTQRRRGLRSTTRTLGSPGP
jgi:hypothetical protein